MKRKARAAESFEAHDVKCECGTRIGTDEEIYMKSVPFEVIDIEDGWKVICMNCAKSFEAESKFDKLSNEIAKDYEKKGKSKEEADKIGNATAYKIGVAKYGKRGMKRKARAGRAMNAETFGAETDYDDYIQRIFTFINEKLGNEYFLSIEDEEEVARFQQAFNEEFDENAKAIEEANDWTWEEILGAEGFDAEFTNQEEAALRKYIDIPPTNMSSDKGFSEQKWRKFNQKTKGMIPTELSIDSMRRKVKQDMPTGFKVVQLAIIGAVAGWATYTATKNDNKQ